MCSEVIEHVYPDVLDAFLKLTLDVYRPEILIVTTPNGEYNVNFPDLKYNTPESVFRHDDHKFEWTRKEFESWYVSQGLLYAVQLMDAAELGAKKGQASTTTAPSIMASDCYIRNTTNWKTDTVHRHACSPD